MNQGRFSHLFEAEAMPSNQPAMPFACGSSAAGPNLVPCAVHPSLLGAAQALYRLAYEQALAASRPSRFEQAARAYPN